MQSGLQPAEALGRHRRHAHNEVELDVAEVLRWVGRIAGDTDPRFERLARVLTRR